MIEEQGGGASRSTEPAAGSSSGTDIELLYLIESLRTGDSRFHSLFKELIERETAHVKELMQQAFDSRDKALELEYGELLRRLDVLNHAHEQAREKERDFISRDAYDTFVLRYQDAHESLKREVAAADKSIVDRIDNLAVSIAQSQADTQKVLGNRLSALESFQSKLLGLALAAPFVSALAVYLITRK